LEFVIVRIFDNYIPGNLMLQRLEEEGITAYLQDESTVTTAPYLSMAVGGIKLMVPQDQAQQAVELMKAWDNEYNQSASCPKCGSHDFVVVPQAANPANWLTAIVTWMLGSYAISTKEVFKCNNCGTEFERTNDQEQPEADPSENLPE
jgi:DNA-directed RNA polymerase subunit RPC12/RpoP